MELIIKYTVYLMPFLLIITTIAIGILFNNKKCAGNALLLVGFIMHAVPFVTSLLLNISPMEINENNEAVKRIEGFLSFYQLFIIELIAYFSIALGFILNAYTSLKKPNKTLKRTTNP